MRTEDMEVYPILHKERVYNVITEIDLTFIQLLIASRISAGGSAWATPPASFRRRSRRVGSNRALPQATANELQLFQS